MKSHEEVEATLEQLGNAWPENDSLVERVLHGLETTPPVLATKQPRTRWMKRVAVCAMAFVVFVVLALQFKSDNSLLAQARNAIRNARTFQCVITTPAKGDKPAQVLRGQWYERNVGFREVSPTDIVVGNSEGTWRYQKHNRVAVKTSGNEVGLTVNNLLNDNNVGRLLKNQEYERYEAGDQNVNGKPCKAYLLMPAKAPNIQEFRDKKRRFVCLFDDSSRIVQMVNEIQVDEAWTEESLLTMKYDEPIERTLFEPRFGNDVTVVDIDSAFDEFVNLDKAVHREERKGLIYAIHRVERFENGGLFLISSVRGTDATLKKYPLEQSQFNRHIRVKGPAYIYQGPLKRAFSTYDVELATMTHLGICVIWRAIIPVNPEGGDIFNTGYDPATKRNFALPRGQVKFPVGFNPQGEYGKANFLDKNGVTHSESWDVILDVEKPATLPTFDTIIRQVYSDVSALDAVYFKYLNMGYRGLMPVSLSDLHKISVDDYRAAVMDDVRWWKEGCPQDDPRVLKLKGKSVPPKK
ncbi:MAG: hypothetical protein K0U86_02500 [Planctomycetes bacterium]|nr:hypothetical protein [Planctomycetota bacterium]MCH9723760.1 hypothetical protein [Planctomycetota bacterium]MCH9776072.1 hypothetical protein [Planctomycetota bacterium]MCH9789813.1 hypothetical protein [Planctomycetota bacterium]